MAAASDVAVALVWLSYSLIITGCGDALWEVYFDELIEWDDGHRFLASALALLLACHAWTVVSPLSRLVQALQWAAFVVFVLKNAFMIRAPFVWLHIAAALSVLASLLLV